MPSLAIFAFFVANHFLSIGPNGKASGPVATPGESFSLGPTLYRHKERKKHKGGSEGSGTAPLGFEPRRMAG